MSQNPPVTEKTMVDIDVSKGLDEAVAEENVDWTKKLTRLENLVSEGGNLVLRPGMQSMQAVPAPAARLAALADGVGVVGQDFQLYHLQESANASGGMPNKGKMPEFTVTSEPIAGENSSTSTNTTHPIGTYQILATDGGGATYRYKVTCYVNFSSGTPASVLCIDVLDLYGGNMIRRYKTEVGALQNAVATLCGETLFIFIKRSGVAVEYVTLDFFDDATLPANLNDGSHDFLAATASGATGDTLVGAVSTSSAAYMLLSGTTPRVAKYDSDGTYNTEQALTSFNAVGGIDTDGTSIYIAGTAASFDPASLSLTSWHRDLSASWPISGIASAGTSGSNTANSSAFDPSNGTALNGHGTLDYDGSNDRTILSGTTDTYINTNSGSGWMLMKADTAAAPTSDVYTDECLLVDSGGTAGFSVGFTSSGVRIEVVDSGGRKKTSHVACSTGSWHLVQWKIDGTDIKIRVDGGSWTSQAAGAITGGLANNFYVGTEWSIGGTAKFDGTIAEWGISDTVISDANFDNVRSYINARYGVSI